MKRTNWVAEGSQMGRYRAWRLMVGLCLLAAVMSSCSAGQDENQIRIGVLLADDARLIPFQGVKDGLRTLGYTEGEDLMFDVYNAEGDRTKLATLAEQLVAAEPNLALAGGGVEADALKMATADTELPVIFLAVASSVERGLVESSGHPGGNLTGIDTDDAKLTGKRLELLTQAFPEVQRVLVLNVPSITPAALGTEIARQTADALGIELIVMDVETPEDIKAAAATITAETADAMLILPAAPIWGALREVLYPISLAYAIPIFGVNREDVDQGAVLSYAASRYDAGVQAARIVDQVLRGDDPATTPVERPERLEFVVNRSLLTRMNLTIPNDVWVLVDEAVDVELE